MWLILRCAQSASGVPIASRSQIRMRFVCAVCWSSLLVELAVASVRPRATTGDPEATDVRRSEETEQSRAADLSADGA